jgi:hypothetical protein
MKKKFQPLSEERAKRKEASRQKFLARQAAGRKRTADRKIAVDILREKRRLAA